MYHQESGTSLSVAINCPRSLNFNLSPSSVESAIALHKIITESDPKVFRKLIVKRDIMLFRSIWDDYTEQESDSLSEHDVVNVLQTAADFYWRDETAGLTAEVKDQIVMTVLNLVERDVRRMISFQSMERAWIKIQSRCYFLGAADLHVKNSYGRSLAISTDRKLKSIKDGCSGSVMLKVSDKEAASSGRQALEASKHLPFYFGL